MNNKNKLIIRILAIVALVFVIAFSVLIIVLLYDVMMGGGAVLGVTIACGVLGGGGFVAVRILMRRENRRETEANVNKNLPTYDEIKSNTGNENDNNNENE